MSDMELFAGHSYSRVTSHDRLPVVPDIEEEDEDEEEEGYKRTRDVEAHSTTCPPAGSNPGILQADSDQLDSSPHNGPITFITSMDTISNKSNTAAESRDSQHNSKGTDWTLTSHHRENQRDNKATVLPDSSTNRDLARRHSDSLDAGKSTTSAHNQVKPFSRFFATPMGGHGLTTSKLHSGIPASADHISITNPHNVGNTDGLAAPRQNHHGRSSPDSHWDSSHIQPGTAVKDNQHSHEHTKLLEDSTASIPHPASIHQPTHLQYPHDHKTPPEASSQSEPFQKPEDTTGLFSPAVENREFHFSPRSSRSSSASSIGDVSTASFPDFHILKSAMKRSCEEHKAGKRRLSLFNQVMRRVSIHRRESTPTGRIATFLFGVEDPAANVQQQTKEEADAEDKEAHKEADENGGPARHTHHYHRSIRGSHLRESLFLILSGLYGIIVVILGAVIPITEIFMADAIASSFEAFYVYLYLGSVLFLGYVYAYLLRRNRLKTELLTRTLSRSLSWTRAWGKSMNKGQENLSRSKLRKRMISLDVSNHHTGTFYLRLGVLGFGIGSMIHSGLNFGTYFAVFGASCNEPLKAVEPMIHLVFTFSQLYFIFMNSKMCIHRYKKLARFGLMHMCATNICVWFRSIVVETLHVIHSQAHSGEHHDSPTHLPDSSSHKTSVGHAVPTGLKAYKEQHKLLTSPVIKSLPGSSLTQELTFSSLNSTLYIGRQLLEVSGTEVNESGVTDVDDPCHWSVMMGKAVEAAGPYLYPCTIEYSLMCAGILYIMWKNVGKRPRRPRGTELGEDEDDQRLHRMSVDCTGSSRGLFLGILLMVATIISIIAFYMLVNKEETQLSGIILTHLSETIIYTLTLIALFLAAYRMKTLTFHNQHEADLEDILILISYTGLLAFIVFSLVASVLSPPDTKSGLTVLSSIMMLLQSTVQTIFMLAGDRMSASTELQERKKPGREFITFLLISNFAMWAINTFQTQTPQHNPVQAEFYGPEAWAIFTHISVPLGIYYRFHSTVCFSNIWKNAWKKRKH